MRQTCTPTRPFLLSLQVYQHAVLFLLLSIPAICASLRTLPTLAIPHHSIHRPFQSPDPPTPSTPAFLLRKCPISLVYPPTVQPSIPPVCVLDTMVPATTRIPSTPLTRVQVAEALDGQETAILEQADRVISLQFQQAINCCGLTSVAYALSAIGVPTSVDDLFLVIGVDVDSAVGDGMTLAEMYDASLRYINRTNIPVFVECYHFDKFVATPEGFKKACDADAKGGIDDIVVLNFHSGIAHGWEKGGGGHFSIMTALAPKSDDVIMADVHGIKYGSFWSTPYMQMFTAMADKDSCGRARGALRFGRTDKTLTRPIPGMTPTLLDWTSPPPPFRSSYLQKYIPAKWDEGIGVRNMAGTCALASAMRLLEGENSRVARLDEIMRALNASYTKQLNNFMTADEMVHMANRLREKEFTTAFAKVICMQACKGVALMETLSSIGCGQERVAVLVAYDFNEAYGAPLIVRESGEAGALSHGAKSWSLIADVDSERNVSDTGAVVIAPAHHVILTGRLWTTSANRLAMGMRSLSGLECKVVVLDSR